MRYLLLILAIAVVAAIVFPDDIRRFIASFGLTPTPVVLVITATPTDMSTSTATLMPTHTPAPTSASTPAPTPTPPVCGRVELVLMGAGKEHKPCYTPTPAPVAGAVPQATPTPIPTATATPAHTATPTSSPTASVYNSVRPDIDILRLEASTHELINEQRIKHGLSPLKHAEDFRLVARSHSQDMAERDYFSHDSPEGLRNADRIKRSGLRCRQSGENIHRNWLYDSYRTRNGRVVSYDWFTLEELAQAAVKGWMGSTGHRAAILNASYGRAGMGIAISSTDRVLFTQNFCN